MEAFELRKRRELNKKFNKQVAVQRRDEKRQKVKDEVNEVKRIRLSGKSSGEDLNNILEGNSQQKGKSNKRKAMVGCISVSFLRNF